MRYAITAVAAAITVVVAVTAYRYWQWSRPWLAWQSYRTVFVQNDGRVIDRTAGGRSTSEGQAYSLFFALVANDRPLFDRILGWTEANLSGGPLDQRLPAWLWGQREDGSWGVKDPNPASDADLWIAYSLMEAARLWQAPAYGRKGRALLDLIRAQELAEVPGAGIMLLPAPQGFQLEDGRWRLNPSYLPEFQLRYFASIDPYGPWKRVWSNHLTQMQRLLQGGIAPDWYQVDASGKPLLDAVSGERSSYDAIRVYLWAGISAVASGERAAAPLLQLLAPYAALIRAQGQPPEVVDAASGRSSGGAPIGYSAAVLPFLAVVDEDTAATQRVRLKNSRQEGGDGNLGTPPHYYDQVLALFGEGWAEQRYRIDTQGQVIPRWSKTCCGWPY